MLTETKQSLRRVLLPLARTLAAAGVQPDQLTAAGLLAAALAGLSIALGNLALGIVWLLINALCDMLDGDVARLGPRRTGRFGAFLDSTVDRLAETLVFGGLLIGRLYHGGGVGWLWMSIWLLALAGSYLVSYTRARAEGLGFGCQVGIADRSLRVVIVLILLLLGLRASGYPLALLAVLTWTTVGQRVRHVWLQDRERQAAAAAPAPAATPPAPPPGEGPAGGGVPPAEGKR